MSLNPYQQDNLANWNDRVPIHVASQSYHVDRYAEDTALLSEIIAFDAPLLGDIAGLDVAHFQCHIGTDSISLARLGATVTGLDFSASAVEAATTLAERAKADASFVAANVYDAGAALGHERFDLVYTSVGTITWIGELDRWANAIAAVLRPGGSFYIRDIHPTLWVFEEIGGHVIPYYDYFTSPESPLTLESPTTYTDDTSGNGITNTRSHEWNHSLADILNALAAAGLRVDRMLEHEGIDWPFVPSAVKEGTQWFAPEPLRGKVPAMFSLWATKL